MAKKNIWGSGSERNTCHVYNTLIYAFSSLIMSLNDSHLKYAESMLSSCIEKYPSRASSGK